MYASYLKHYKGCAYYKQSKEIFLIREHEKKYKTKSHLIGKNVI